MSTARAGVAVACIVVACIVVAGCSATYPVDSPALPSRPDLSSTTAPLPDLAAADLAVPISTDDLAIPTVPADLTASIVSDLAAPIVSDLAAPIVSDLASAVDLARCTDDDDDGGAAATLYLVAPTSSSLFAARARAGTWSTLPTVAAASTVDEIALALVAGHPLAVARLHDGTLASAVGDGCTGFGALAAVADYVTAGRPAIGGGAVADIVFRGGVNGDQRYYWLRFDGRAWGSLATQGNFLSTQSPALVRRDGDVHTFFTGTDTNLYDGVVQASGGGAATQLSGNTSMLAPAVVLTADGDAHVVYAGINRHLYWFIAARPGQVHDLCDGQGPDCYIVTDAAPVLALGSDGAPVIVFHGTDGKLYGSRLTGGQWSAAVAVSAGETTAFAPALARGVAGNLADVVWVRDGDQVARHAQLTIDGWQPPITVAATALSGAPALASAP
jgi:hypothetical protein